MRYTVLIILIILSLSSFAQEGGRANSKTITVEQSVIGLSGTPYRVYYTNGTGSFTEIVIGAADQVLTSNGANAAPTFEDAPGGLDTTAIHKNVSGEIAALAEKASPVSGDLLVIEDSQASNEKKKVQIGNLPGAIPPGTQLLSYSANMAHDYLISNTALFASGGDVATYTLQNVPDNGFGAIVMINGGGDGINSIVHVGKTIVYLTGFPPTANKINSEAGEPLYINYHNVRDTIYIGFPTAAQQDTLKAVLYTSGLAEDIEVGTKKDLYSDTDSIKIVKVRAIVDEDNPPTGSSATFRVRRNGINDILSADITINAGEHDSETATPAVISDGTLSPGDQITGEVVTVGSTNPGKGGQIEIYFIKQ